MDKPQLLASLIGQVEAKLAELRSGYGSARDVTLSSPHVMKGKREVFGQEAAYLANALALSIRERERELQVLQALRLPAAAERVALGCLVGLGEGPARVDGWYLLLPVCGGAEVRGAAGDLVRVITPAAPIARALLGRAAGDTVTLPSAAAATVLVLR
jgi:transcription elongation GreA/GreB family factor